MKKNNITPQMTEKTQISQNYWDSNADYWSQQLANKQDYTREYFGKPAFLEFLGDVTGLNILDIGCGDGELTRIIADQALKITGIDISEKMIDKAKKLTINNNVTYHHSAVELMPNILEGQVFHCIYSYMVLCCVEDIYNFFNFSYDLLEDKGRLVLAIPHPCFNNKPCDWVTDDKQSSIKGLIISKYFDEEPYIREWDFFAPDNNGMKHSMQEIRFPRTLSTYLNVIADCGFVLGRILEPRPIKSLVNKLNKLNRWYNHVPCFMFIECHRKK